MFLKHCLEGSLWKHSCRPILEWTYPQMYWEKEASLLLSFAFGPVPKAKSSICISHLFDIRVVLFCLLRLLTPLDFYWKYLICYFSPTPSSVVNLRDFYLCINDIFDPFFLVLQPPLTWPLFSFNPFSNTKDHLSSELPSCQYRPVLSVPSPLSVPYQH